MTEETTIITEELDLPTEHDPIDDQPLDTPADDQELTAEEVDTEDNGESIESLKKKIVSLKAKLAEMEAFKESQTKLIEEIGDFRDLFPEVELKNIPDSVWESVKNGTPLIASYALYEKRMEAMAARIALVNASNASRSPGVVGKNTSSEYFSPDEVRKMSRAEVHANYSKIKESMKKWI